MTREEFCKLMEQAKTQAGITTNDLSFDMRMQWSTLRRFEKGEHNFSLVKVMEYLRVLHAQLVIYNEKSTVTIIEYSQLIKWLVSARKDNNYSQRKLAEAISISYVMLARVESNKSNLSIDMLLKILEVLGYNIKIVNNK